MPPSTRRRHLRQVHPAPNRPASTRLMLPMLRPDDPPGLCPATEADPLRPARWALWLAQLEFIEMDVLLRARDLFESMPPKPGTMITDCVRVIQALARLDAWERTSST